jgi:hypothetical protein
MTYTLLKNYSGIFAIIITIVAFVPYIKSILQNKIKPHVFTWIIWSSATLTVFFAELFSGGGMGCWAIGLSGCISVVIALLSLIKKCDKHITKSDWICFISGILAIPVWIVTKDPLWAVLLLTAIDVTGYIPTIKKVSKDPYSDSVGMFTLTSLRNVFSIIALDEKILTNIIFQAATITGNMLIVCIIVYKKYLNKSKK